MKIATWNVNSLKVRLPQVLDWLESSQCDILCLQETKLTDDSFPWEAIEEKGYHVAFSGQKTYNGVAIISREHPIRDVVTDVPNLDDPQRRIMAATIGDVRVLDLYVVNGSEVGSDKYAYKLHWMDKVTRYIESQVEEHEQFIVLGDFNIAPDDRDVHDPKRWQGKILCSKPEREGLQRILDLGFTDVFREFEQAENSFSWWDYRSGGYDKNQGLRIDLVLSSKALTPLCTKCIIDTEPRTWERPSDHTPVVAEFDIA